MGWQLKDRVKDTTTTTGTGTITVSGTAPTGFVAFGTAYATGDTFYYAIVGGAEWEVGVGRLATATTIGRDMVLASSNSGALVNFSAGTKDVFVTIPAQSASTIGQELANSMGLALN
jgi:hypothetical protein